MHSYDGIIYQGAKSTKYLCSIFVLVGGAKLHKIYTLSWKFPVVVPNFCFFFSKKNRNRRILIIPAHTRNTSAYKLRGETFFCFVLFFFSFRFFVSNNFFLDIIRFTFDMSFVVKCKCEKLYLYDKIRRRYKINVKYYFVTNEISKVLLKE